MDDGSGVMLPYMTEIRLSIRENAMAGFELTELVAFWTTVPKATPRGPPERY